MIKSYSIFHVFNIRLIKWNTNIYNCFLTEYVRTEYDSAFKHTHSIKHSQPEKKKKTGWISLKALCWKMFRLPICSKQLRSADCRKDRRRKWQSFAYLVVWESSTHAGLLLNSKISETFVWYWNKPTKPISLSGINWLPVVTRANRLFFLLRQIRAAAGGFYLSVCHRCFLFSSSLSASCQSICALWSLVVFSSSLPALLIPLQTNDLTSKAPCGNLTVPHFISTRGRFQWLETQSGTHSQQVHTVHLQCRISPNLSSRERARQFTHKGRSWRWKASAEKSTGAEWEWMKYWRIDPWLDPSRVSFCLCNYDLKCHFPHKTQHCLNHAEFLFSL